METFEILDDLLQAGGNKEIALLGRQSTEEQLEHGAVRSYHARNKSGAW